MLEVVFAQILLDTKFYRCLFTISRQLQKGMSLLIDDDNYRFYDRRSKNHFKWSFGRHKSDNVNTSNAFIPPRYMFSYETTDSNVKHIEFTKPSELLYPNGGVGDRQETFDFSTAFSFSENKLDANDLDVANNYKTIFTYSDPICNGKLVI
ncbi:unnamed protein product [Trichobilharzia regenti]|nr:unnamed protein product [Trichobilharzia regenti]